MGLSPSAPDLPPSPQVFPIDIPAAMQAGLDITKFGYDTSDLDFVNHFPGIVATRQSSIDQALKDLKGVSPTMESEFTKRAGGQVFSAFGGGSENPINLQTDSLGRNTFGTSVANQTRSFQDQARSELDTLLNANPERQFVSGSDAANIAIRNNALLNQANQNALNRKFGVQNANSSASAAGTQTAVGAGTALTGAAISALGAAGAL